MIRTFWNPKSCLIYRSVIYITLTNTTVNFRNYQLHINSHFYFPFLLFNTISRIQLKNLLATEKSNNTRNNNFYTINYSNTLKMMQ